PRHLLHVEVLAGVRRAVDGGGRPQGVRGAATRVLRGRARPHGAAAGVVGPGRPTRPLPQRGRARAVSAVRRALATLALTLALAFVVGSASAQSPAPVTLAFSTLGQGTACYVYGATMAELWRKTLPAGSNIDVKPFSGGVGNPRLVAKNETPLGLSFTVTNRWAMEGKEGFDAKL